MSSGGLSAEERNRFPEMLQRGSRSGMVDFMGRDDFTMENLPFNGDYGAACNAGDGLAAMIISKFKIRPVVPEASDTPECPICLGAFDSMVAVLAAPLAPTFALFLAPVNFSHLPGSFLHSTFFIIQTGLSSGPGAPGLRGSRCRW